VTGVTLLPHFLIINDCGERPRMTLDDLGAESTRSIRANFRFTCSDAERSDRSWSREYRIPWYSYRGMADGGGRQADPRTDLSSEIYGFWLIHFRLFGQVGSMTNFNLTKIDIIINNRLKSFDFHYSEKSEISRIPSRQPALRGGLRRMPVGECRRRPGEKGCVGHKDLRRCTL
jgi:hypothetical protein